jgi:hypothetical protein
MWPATVRHLDGLCQKGRHCGRLSRSRNSSILSICMDQTKGALCGASPVSVLFCIISSVLWRIGGTLPPSGFSKIAFAALTTAGSCATYIPAISESTTEISRVEELGQNEEGGAPQRRDRQDALNQDYGTAMRSLSITILA